MIRLKRFAACAKDRREIPLLRDREMRGYARNRREIPPLRGAARSQERTRKKRPCRSGRNDRLFCRLARSNEQQIPHPPGEGGGFGMTGLVWCGHPSLH